MEELNKYITKDKEYMMTAIPTTTNRFGPSGSLKDRSIAREKKRAVTNKMSNDIFFDLKYIW